MTDTAMKRALRATYDRTFCAYRRKDGGTEQTVYIDVPCALSRSALVSAPTPPRRGAALTEGRYALALYTAPDIVLRLGDRVVVSDASGRLYHARASDSVCYPSHCVTVADVYEVTLPVNAEGGQDSGDSGNGTDGGGGEA